MLAEPGSQVFSLPAGVTRLRPEPHRCRGDAGGLPPVFYFDVRHALLLAILFHGAADAGPLPQSTDARDGREYPVVRIAGMEWLGRNLEYAMPRSHCLDDDEENCAQLGRLYTWDDAMRACPEGWHLSTEQEWRRLEVHLGMPAEELDWTRGRGEGVGDTLKIGGSSGLDIPFGGWRRPDGEFRAATATDSPTAAAPSRRRRAR